LRGQPFAQVIKQRSLRKQNAPKPSALDPLQPIMERSHPFQRALRHPGRHQSERPANFDRNRWPTSIGMPGRHRRNLEASVRSRDEDMAIGGGRDLIEAGLNEPAGWRAQLWGLCLRRPVRDGAAAEMGDDFDGLSVEAGGDCGRLIDGVDAVMGSTGAIVVQHRPGPTSANATPCAGVIGGRHRESGAAKPVVPQDVSFQKDGRGGAAGARTASMTMTPPQPGQRSGWWGGTVSGAGSATACGRSSSRRQTASLSAR